MHISRLTEKEIRIISEELRKRKSDHGKRVELSDKELVEFLASAEAFESELGKQRLRALENKTVINQIATEQSSSISSTQSTGEDSSTQIGNHSEELHSQSPQEVEDDLEQLEYFGEFRL